MALWDVSRQEIGLEASARIIEPAQVLIMTAIPLVWKNADIIKSFNDTAARLDSQLHTVTEFIRGSASTKDTASD